MLSKKTYPILYTYTFNIPLKPALKYLRNTSLWYKLCVRYLNTKMISLCGHFCDFKWLERHFKNFLVFLFKLHILLFFLFSFKCVLTTLVLAALTLPAREDSRVLSLLFIFSDSETSLLVVQPWRSWWNFHRGSEK